MRQLLTNFLLFSLTKTTVILFSDMQFLLLISLHWPHAAHIVVYCSGSTNSPKSRHQLFLKDLHHASNFSRYLYILSSWDPCVRFYKDWQLRMEKIESQSCSYPYLSSTGFKWVIVTLNLNIDAVGTFHILRVHTHKTLPLSWVKWFD